jgi:hypothetical protein
MLLDGYRLRQFFDDATGSTTTRAKQLAREIDWSKWQPNRPTVLYLDRALFRKDVEEMQARTAINFVGISTTKVKRILERWVPPVGRDQTYFTKMLETNLYHLKKTLEAFGVAFLTEATVARRIDAVMAGNTDYWQDEAIKLACERLGIPYLVLARENYVTGYDYTMVTERMAKAKFKFRGDGVAVFSARSKRAFEHTGAFVDANIAVTGAPRFDKWAEVPTIPEAERNLMILLSYAAPLYMGEDNFRQVTAMFVEAAAQAPAHHEYLLKVKKRSDADIVHDNSPGLEKTKVRVIWDDPLYDLYPRARAVIGFNTLAALEGLLADVPVIVPTWGDALREPTALLIRYDDPIDQAAIYFPKSPEEFKALLRQASEGTLRSKGNLAERRACFSQRIYLPENSTSSREVEKFILANLATSKP